MKKPEINCAHDELREVVNMTAHPRNPNTHNEGQIKLLAKIIKHQGWRNPIVVSKRSGFIVAGHGRLMAAEQLGLEQVPVDLQDFKTEADELAHLVADNRIAELAEIDRSSLADIIGELDTGDLDLELTGFDVPNLEELMTAAFPEDPYADGVDGSMEDNYGQPPFSILDTRKGSWLDRKRLWHGIIQDNGESREGALSNGSNLISQMNNGVSILDPVMSELVVKWFGTMGGKAFDPFAGDSVFGFVSAHCGMEFQGIELRSEQVILNQKRVDDAGLSAVYYNDSGEEMDKYINDASIDLVFSCPPYADLEVYSNNPKDLSNMSHDDFFQVYKGILQGTFKKLKENRFAVIVMGEVRSKKGAYIGTIPKTIEIMEQAGYDYHNEIILVNGAGTLPLRAGKSMIASRKIGKMHQNILVFVKGCPNKAAKELGEINAPIEFEDEGNE